MDDSAANVYNYPANRFCAEFVGSPAMNFFDEVSVSKSNTLSILGSTIQLDKNQMKKLSRNRTVDVGIRGYDIAITSEGYPAKIEYCEPVESELLIHVKVDDKSIIVVEKADETGNIRYFRDQDVFLKADTERLHIFDQDGNRI